GQAVRQLRPTEQSQKFRHWEWGRLWYLTQLHKRRFNGHDDSIEGIAVSPDGSRLATAGRDGIVILWNVNIGNEIDRFEHSLVEKVGDPISFVRAVAFSPDGTKLATAGDDR